MGQLSTHVLDTAAGKPAAGIGVELYRIDEQRTLLATTATNADGRTDAPLLTGEQFAAGVYELVFNAGAFFRSQGIAVPDPPFLNDVVIRFGVADPHARYHVPLLLSPYGYSTYRGS